MPAGVPLDSAPFVAGTRIATAAADGTVRVWDTRSGRDVLVLRGHHGPVWSTAFSPDGARVASAGDDGTVRIWDAHTGHVLRVLRGHDGSVYSVVWSPDGDLVMSASNDRTARIWDAATGVTLTTLRGNPARRLRDRRQLGRQRPRDSGTRRDGTNLSLRRVRVARRAPEARA